MQIPETEIIVSKDGMEILRKTVRPGEYIIGRDPGCQIQIQVELVSRRHAQLTVNFDHALIEDLGSSNGTFINGKPVVGSSRIWPNQKIEVGSATIEIHRAKAFASPDVSLAPSTATVQRLLPEELLHEHRYDIGGVVAQGGMGAILDAREATIERKVAMKVMLDGSSPDDLKRFVAEAKITGQLEHPNIVPVHELGVDENEQPFYTMKFVKGVTLKEVIDLLAAKDKEARKKYQLAALLTIFQKVCDAVAFAHSKGVIHRDLKPENIMLGEYGEVLVMDWGLSKVLGDSQGPDSESARFLRRPVSDSLDSGSTVSGATIGTPRYMAPEQARGEVESLDARADIYALGATLYEILSLRKSVDGGALEVVEKVGRGEIEPLIGIQADKTPLPHLPGGHIPESLAAVVRKAMEFEKTKRYASVENLQADITAYQNGFATSAEQAGPIKQLLLLIQRNKGVFVTTFAAWFVITVLAILFMFNLRAKERRAVASEEVAVAERNRAQNALADAESERNLAQKERAYAEKERNIAQQARTEAETQRNRTQQALAETETERNLAEKALANYEAEHKRAESESSRAERAMAAVKTESNRAAKAVADLKNTAPDIFLMAKTLLAQNKIADALEKIDDAINLDDTRPDYHLFRANLLETRQRLSSAVAEYQRVLALRPHDESATRNLALCEGLLAAQGKDPALSKDLQKRLLAYLYDQQRTKEAAILSNQLDPEGAAAKEELLKRLSKYTDLPDWYNSRISSLPDGTLEIDLKGLPQIRDISMLEIKDLPVSRVIVSRTQVSDLSPLKKLKLTSFFADGCTHLYDISPLRGQPLKNIILSNTAVTDLSPLLDCPTLEEIVLPDTPLVSLPTSVVNGLKRLPNLKRISFTLVKTHPAETADEFWSNQHEIH